MFETIYDLILKEALEQDDWDDARYDRVERYLDIQRDILYNIVHEVKKLKKGSKKTISWVPFPSAGLVKAWKDYATYHQVRNPRLIDQLAEDMIKKVAIIDLGTTLGGHSQIDPLTYLNDEFDDEFDEEFTEKISDYLVDSRGTWLISDYGLEKMQKVADELLNSKLTSEEKILICDKMLNIVHQRSDLAAWFVQGGRATLDHLFEN